MDSNMEDPLKSKRRLRLWNPLKRVMIRRREKFLKLDEISLQPDEVKSLSDDDSENNSQHTPSNTSSESAVTLTPPRTIDADADVNAKNEPSSPASRSEGALGFEDSYETFSQLDVGESDALSQSNLSKSTHIIADLKKSASENSQTDSKEGGQDEEEDPQEEEEGEEEIVFTSSTDQDSTNSQEIGVFPQTDDTKAVLFNCRQDASEMNAQEVGIWNSDGDVGKEIFLSFNELGLGPPSGPPSEASEDQDTSIAVSRFSSKQGQVSLTKSDPSVSASIAFGSTSASTIAKSAGSVTWISHEDVEDNHSRPVQEVAFPAFDDNFFTLNAKEDTTGSPFQSKDIELDRKTRVNRLIFGTLSSEVAATAATEVAATEVAQIKKATSLQEESDDPIESHISSRKSRSLDSPPMRTSRTNKPITSCHSESFDAEIEEINRSILGPPSMKKIFKPNSLDLDVTQSSTYCDDETEEERPSSPSQIFTRHSANIDVSLSGPSESDLSEDEEFEGIPDAHLLAVSRRTMIKVERGSTSLLKHDNNVEYGDLSNVYSEDLGVDCNIFADIDEGTIRSDEFSYDATRSFATRSIATGSLKSTRSQGGRDYRSRRARSWSPERSFLQTIGDIARDGLCVSGGNALGIFDSRRRR